jgi:hypothetical protein
MIPSGSNDPRAPTDGSLARLMESAVELVRAEIAVASARGRQALLKGLAAVLATLLAAALLQVALATLVLSPLLLRALPNESIWAALALPALLALASTAVAALAWRSARRSLLPESATPSPSPSRAESRAPGPLMIPVPQGKTEQ